MIFIILPVIAGLGTLVIIISLSSIVKIRYQFLVFAVVNVGLFLLLSTGDRGAAGGWFIMLIQVPSVIFGLIGFLIVGVKKLVKINPKNI